MPWNTAALLRHGERQTAHVWGTQRSWQPLQRQGAVASAAQEWQRCYNHGKESTINRMRITQEGRWVTQRRPVRTSSTSASAEQRRWRPFRLFG